MLLISSEARQFLQLEDYQVTKKKKEKKKEEEEIKKKIN